MKNEKPIDIVHTSHGLVSLFYRCMPTAEQTKWIEIGEASLRFNWRGKIYKIWVDNHHVEESQGSMAISSDSAALIEALIHAQCRIEKQP